MQRCLELALKGRYSAAPNPLVGSLIVHNDEIIGEGYHFQAGEPHAEVNAIRSVKDPQLLKQSTLYVNLEPCSHYGRTPPCSLLVKEKGIPKVVMATRDYNAQVNGQGVQILRAAGIDVTEGVLEKEAQFINRRFFTYHREKRPYITLKWAQSSDGIMDPKRDPNTKGIQWISQAETQVYSHRLRAENQAILVGRKTVEIDNPSLDCRAFQGKNPLRVILDPNNKLHTSFKVFRDTNFLRFCSEPKEAQDRQLNLQKPLIPQVLQSLYQKGIQSILVEGGQHTLSAFIEADLWDEAHQINAPHPLGSGLKAPKLSAKRAESLILVKDQISIFYRK